MPTASSECQKCDGTGWQMVIPDEEIHFQKTVRSCTCRRKRIIKSKLGKIPEQFRPCSFKNYKPKDPTQAEALERVRDNPDNSFYFWGSYGRGKTHLAVAQFCQMVLKSFPCLWFSMFDLLSEFRACEMDTGYQSELYDTLGISHLFLDDIDKFKRSEFRDQCLFDFFDHAYRNKQKLTITSNLPLSDLVKKDVLDSSVVRRIDDSCTALRV